MTSMGQPRGFDEDEHFYEDDEPLEKITAAFERGKHGVMAPLVGVDTRGLTPERYTATATVGGIIMTAERHLESTPEDQVPRKLAYMEAHPDVVFHPPRRSDPMWTAVLNGGDVEVRTVDLELLLDKLEALDRPQ